MIRGRTSVPIKAIRLNGVALRNIQVFTIASPTSRAADVDEVGDEANGADLSKPAVGFDCAGTFRGPPGLVSPKSGMGAGLIRFV